jgi:hypothetical protein
MTTIATPYGEVPVFSLFSVLDHGVSPSNDIVGHIHSWNEYQHLVPAPDTRVEIERARDVEEIRVIRNLDGDYHVTVNSSVAQIILKQVDEQTNSIFEMDVKAFPENMPDSKTNPFYRNIISYDHDGDRILPGIKRAGYLTTLEEYKAMEGQSVVWYEDDDFVGVEDVKTGSVWWATEELKQEVLEKSRLFEQECKLDPECDSECLS